MIVESRHFHLTISLMSCVLSSRRLQTPPQLCPLSRTITQHHPQLRPHSAPVPATFRSFKPQRLFPDGAKRKNPALCRNPPLLVLVFFKADHRRRWKRWTKRGCLCRRAFLVPTIISSWHCGTPESFQPKYGGFNAVKSCADGVVLKRLEHPGSPPLCLSPTHSSSARCLTS